MEDEYSIYVPHKLKSSFRFYEWVIELNFQIQDYNN